MKTVVLEFTEEQIEHFNTCKTIVGSNRNRFLAALLVVGFYHFNTKDNIDAVLDQMSATETLKMREAAKESFNPTPPTQPKKVDPKKSD